MPLDKELQKIGLSVKEARVYLASLELGPASVQDIGAKAKVNRGTTYSILESLIKKRLCSTYEQGKKTFFTASDPDSLDSMFELKKKEVEEEQKYFERILPQLHLLNNQKKDKPVIRFFEGKQGTLQCSEEFLGEYDKNKNEKVRMFYNKDLLNKIFADEERQKYRDIRLKHGIQSMVLYNYKDGEVQNSKDGSRIKISEKQFPVSCDVGIYGDCVRIASLGKKFSAILIKDKEIANTLKSIFDLAWEAASAKASVAGSASVRKKKQ